jgi:hypothetical protein
MGRCHFGYNNLPFIYSTLLGTVEVAASFWILEIAALLV